MKKENKNSNTIFSEQLSYFDHMSEHDFKTKSRELCKTIIIDQKVIEDNYMASRKDYEKSMRKTIDDLQEDASKVTNKQATDTIDRFIEFTKQEARREYNRRLLKIILG